MSFGFVGKEADLYSEYTHVSRFICFPKNVTDYGSSTAFLRLLFFEVPFTLLTHHHLEFSVNGQKFYKKGFKNENNITIKIMFKR